MYKIGDRYKTWFSGKVSGLSIVLEVRPYRGRYGESFTHTLTVTAPNTKAGRLDIATNYEHDARWAAAPSWSDWVPPERDLGTHPLQP